MLVLKQSNEEDHFSLRDNKGAKIALRSKGTEHTDMKMYFKLLTDLLLVACQCYFENSVILMRVRQHGKPLVFRKPNISKKVIFLLFFLKLYLICVCE